MPAKSTTFATFILNAILNGIVTGIANLLANAAAPLTNLYVSLHTSAPAVGGDQTTNEVSTGVYGQYARQAIVRNPVSPAWTVAGGLAHPAAPIVFPLQTTGTGGTATHFGIGTAATGAGVILYFGPLVPNLSLANGANAPTMTTATAIGET